MLLKIKQNRPLRYHVDYLQPFLSVFAVADMYTFFGGVSNLLYLLSLRDPAEPVPTMWTVF